MRGRHGGYPGRKPGSRSGSTNHSRLACRNHGFGVYTHQHARLSLPSVNLYAGSNPRHPPLSSRPRSLAQMPPSSAARSHRNADAARIAAVAHPERHGTPCRPPRLALSRRPAARAPSLVGAPPCTPHSTSATHATAALKQQQLHATPRYKRGRRLCPDDGAARPRSVAVVPCLALEAQLAVLARHGRVPAPLVQLNELDRVPRGAAACSFVEGAAGGVGCEGNRIAVGDAW